MKGVVRLRCIIDVNLDFVNNDAKLARNFQTARAKTNNYLMFALNICAKCNIVAERLNDF